MFFSSSDQSLESESPSRQPSQSSSSFESESFSTNQKRDRAQFENDSISDITKSIESEISFDINLNESHGAEYQSFNMSELSIQNEKTFQNLTLAFSSLTYCISVRL